MKRDPETDHCH